MSKTLKTPNYQNADLKEFTAVLGNQYVTVLATNQEEAEKKIAALESHIHNNKHLNNQKNDDKRKETAETKEN